MERRASPRMHCKHTLQLQLQTVCDYDILLTTQFQEWPDYAADFYLADGKSVIAFCRNCSKCSAILHAGESHKLRYCIGLC
jgi:hypothetical protein